MSFLWVPFLPIYLNILLNHCHVVCNKDNNDDDTYGLNIGNNGRNKNIDKLLPFLFQNFAHVSEHAPNDLPLQKRKEEGEEKNQRKTKKQIS